MFVAIPAHAITVQSPDLDSSLTAMQRLSALARTAQYSRQPEREKKIADILKPIKTTSQLAIFALMARTVALDQSAENHDYVDYFDNAFWQTIRRLSKMQSTQAKTALSDIDRFANLQAGAKLRMDALRTGKPF